MDRVRETQTRTEIRRQGWSLSEFLNLLELRGQTWCMVELRGSAGFNLPGDDGVTFYGLAKGQVRIAGIGGSTLELQQGQVQIILSGEAHAVRTAPDSPTVVLNFLRHEQTVDEPPTFTIGSGALAARLICARLKVNWPGGLKRAAMPAAMLIGGDVHGGGINASRIETLQTFSKGPGATALLTRLASMLLALALRNHPQCPLLFRMSAANDPIAHSLQLLDADLAADWSVEKMARKVGMSRSSFAARFTAEAGQTPMELLTERRMRAAVDMLQQSSLKIAEISARVGYHSEAAFSRRFARFFGVPPGQMRSNEPGAVRPKGWQNFIAHGEARSTH